MRLFLFVLFGDCGSFFLRVLGMIALFVWFGLLYLLWFSWMVWLSSCLSWWRGLLVCL